MTYIACIVLDNLIFESLANDSILKYLNSHNYFIILWKSKFINNEDIFKRIPINGYINGLRNGCKPYRYLRMHLRKYYSDILTLPVVIIDFEKNYINSQYGYDLCINIKNYIIQEEYNNNYLDIINVKQIFYEIQQFIYDYNNSSNNDSNFITEEMLYSNNNIIIKLNDIIKLNNNKKIKNNIIHKKCILIVSSGFFTIYHNVNSKKFQEFLNSCYLIVWINNKNIDERQVKNFLLNIKNNNININFMLFGLDRNIKTISYIRKSIKPTKLPFILVDNLINIYNNNINSFCDFDLYINLKEYLRNSLFYDLNSVIGKIENFNKKMAIIKLNKNYNHHHHHYDDKKQQNNTKSNVIITEYDSDNDIPVKRFKKNTNKNNYNSNNNYNNNNYNSNGFM